MVEVGPRELQGAALIARVSAGGVVRQTADIALCARRAAKVTEIMGLTRLAGLMRELAELAEETAMDAVAAHADMAMLLRLVEESKDGRNLQ